MGKHHRPPLHRGTIHEQVVQEDPQLELDYFAIRSADLAEVEDHPAGIEGRALVAARLGGTRLIDNLVLKDS